MPLDVRIADTNLLGLGTPAQQSLKLSMERYAGEVIAEALRIEAGRNPSGVREVTAAMVIDAVDSLNRGLVKKPVPWGTRLIRILAGVTPFLVGYMSDPERLQQPQNVFILVISLVLAVFFITISVMKE